MLRRLFIAVVALTATACATTSIRDSWYDVDYRGGPMRKIVVLGVSDNVAERRTFEDVMSARLAAVGVAAIPAYRLLPGTTDKVAEGELDRAVRASGTEDRYPVTEVRQYDIAVVETSLFTAKDDRIVWSGLTETWEPRSVAKDAPGFADTIVTALQKRALIPAPR
ncbi:MAG TPA: hypothetical protein VNE58_00920 [Casimicrobiaceae bacterium]|nr:hypothetical protein [Casimicrobiaceae bacterium]